MDPLAGFMRLKVRIRCKERKGMVKAKRNGVEYTFSAKILATAWVLLLKLKV